MNDTDCQALVPSSGRFAIIGDLQPTSRLELWRESNVIESGRILRQVAAEAPDLVVLLGDLVFRGSSDREWSRFDELTAPLREAGVPAFPVLGNHDYWLSPRRALPRYFRRFPHLDGKRWYSRRYSCVGLIFLDSNRFFLREAGWSAQMAWYESELARFDEDPSVRGVLVFVHHPPFTNSTVTGDSRHVERGFVPAFQRASKALAMISGHVHSYERFERVGKTFLVAGGGGGPRVRLAAGSRQRHDDDLFVGPPIRLFHFLLARLLPKGIAMEARGLDKAGDAFLEMDRFDLLFPDSSRRSLP